MVVEGAFFQKVATYGSVPGSPIGLETQLVHDSLSGDHSSIYRRLSAKGLRLSRGGAMKIVHIAVAAVFSLFVSGCAGHLGGLTGPGGLNDRAAVSKLRASAEQGDATAQFKLGELYFRGLGVPKDEVEAVNWYRKAADQGHAIAQNYLGSMYRLGLGVAKDEAEAVKWYRKAAEQGNANGQYSLGVSYEIGLGVPQDQAEAAKWYRKAAEQGEASAQNNLGVAYAEGRGVAKDDLEAVKWFRAAAEQGRPLSKDYCY